MLQLFYLHLTLTRVEREEPTSDFVEEKMAQRWPAHITHLRKPSRF